MDKKNKMLKLVEDATGVFDTAGLNVDESVLPEPDSYDDILKKAVAEERLTGIPVADARIADTAGRSRMAQQLELDQLRKAKIDPEGSRMITPREKSKLAARKNILQKMARKMGSGLGRKAAGLAIGGPLALASELADASEIGLSERDEIIESTKYSPEEKKALLRGLDMKKKLSEESGDVSRDPSVLKAREIGERLKNEYYESMPEEERIKTKEDKKREDAKDARRRLAEEMMKRNILPKVE